ncbi:4'-phosphopantetheinyl transferase domain protein [Solidesulfovibrio magneticus RS-1]|uniref:4'-phosphopantetheinyl transferase domain protein n=2 Tax=Solidesulfovibrio TaxID=2910984 RepID=C4XTY4_SOLM1|nr:4'-phosphopantetheinyl transferase domain protein [Solidesulfovibrio magneticus RS-1]
MGLETHAKSYALIWSMSGRLILVWAQAREPWPDGCMVAALNQLPPWMGREMARWRNPMDRQTRVLGRLLVRLALETLGVANGDLAGWRLDQFGRPYLSGCAADCSVSHSGGLVAAAVSLPGRVGVDVEVLAPLPIEALDAAFCPEEMSDIRSAENQSRRALELWTGKEATLKADGRGMSLDPSLIDARGESIRLGEEVWRIFHPELTPGWLCALVTNQLTPVVNIISTDLAVLLGG